MYEFRNTILAELRFRALLTEKGSDVHLTLGQVATGGHKVLIKIQNANPS
jgi:hypothetical protein